MLRDGPYPWSLKERILGPLGHLSNGDVARLVEKGLGEECRHVVLAHLSRRNNHPELALLAAEEALARAGRRGVRLTVAARRWQRLDHGAPGPARADAGTGPSGSCASSDLRTPGQAQPLSPRGLGGRTIRILLSR